METNSATSQNPRIEGLNINQYNLREYFCVYDRKNDLERRLKYLSLGLKLYLACGHSHDQFIEFHKERRLWIKRNLYFFRILMVILGFYFLYESRFWSEHTFQGEMKLYFVACLVAWFISFVVNVYTKNTRRSLIHTSTALANDRCRNWLLTASLNDNSAFRHLKKKVLEKNFEGYELGSDLLQSISTKSTADDESETTTIGSKNQEMTANGGQTDIMDQINSYVTIGQNQNLEDSVLREAEGEPTELNDTDNFAKIDQPVEIMNTEHSEANKTTNEEMSILNREWLDTNFSELESSETDESKKLKLGIEDEVDNAAFSSELETNVIREDDKMNTFHLDLTEICRQENLFNRLPMVEVINFFHIMCCPALQDKVPQMSEADFISFLRMAFLGAPKVANLRFKHHKNKKKYIRGVFYQFLVKSQTDADENSLNVRDRYAALIYEHFEGFSDKNVLDNFSKDESAWLTNIRANNKDRIPIIQELPN